MNWIMRKKKVEIYKEKTIAVNFISTDQSINFPVACINTDSFSQIEEKLYVEYPELRNKKDKFFLVNGNIIDRSANLEQNKIKNGNQIMINYE